MKKINENFGKNVGKTAILPNIYVDEEGNMNMYACTSSLHGGNANLEEGDEKNEFRKLCINYDRKQYLSLAYAAKAVWRAEQGKSTPPKPVSIAFTLIGAGIYENSSDIYLEIFKDVFDILEDTNITVYCNTFTEKDKEIWDGIAGTAEISSSS
ncbi:MAG: hypothetical protein LBI69_01820 [Puniceicoccales bacterium]|jgi:hypothetical protein|nr:hypothetical protein [Puniceicoccales bacterium]